MLALVLRVRKQFTFTLPFNDPTRCTVTAPMAAINLREPRPRQRLQDSDLRGSRACRSVEDEVRGECADFPSTRKLAFWVGYRVEERMAGVAVLTAPAWPE